VRALTRRVVPEAIRPRVARRVIDAVERVNLAPGTRPQVPAALEAELRARFAPMVQRLELLLDRDLSSWRPARG
jgi:hypothetical protein